MSSEDDQRGAYSVEIGLSAAKALSKIDRTSRIRIVTAIRALATDPRPRGCVKLSGTKEAYRVRVGTYRVVYVVLDSIKIVEVTRIGHRRDVYER